MHGALPLGRLLVESGLVTQEALDDVLAFQKQDGRRLGELLLEKGALHPQALAQFLSHELACPWVALDRVEVGREALNALPREIALKHRMAPIHLRSVRGRSALYVAMDDPTDDAALAAAAAAATMPVRPMIALATEIRILLDRLYAEPPAPAIPETSDGLTPTLPPAGVAPIASVAPPTVTGVAPPASTSPKESGAMRPTKPPPPKVAGVAPPLDESILDEEDVIEVDPNSRPPTSKTNGPRSITTASDTYRKGAVVDGRYELLRDLGGRVEGSRWEVRHLTTTRRSILKIGVRTKGDDTDAEAVRREQVVLTRFQHPGAIDLRDAGTTSIGDPYIVVEMLDGRTLQGLVAARGALPSREACALMRQIADVLASAHDSGVLHHEVRPENVLVVRDAWGVERVKLSHWESSTLSEGVPEPAVDLAGLGACAFLALAGRSRADGEDVTQADLATAVTGVIARAIGGATARRFSSAQAFIDALEAAAPRSRDSLLLLQAAPEHRAPLAARRREPGSSRPPGIPAEVELRRYPRASYRTPVRVQVPNVGTVDGRIEEISARGVFVVARRMLATPIVDGSEVTVRFALPVNGNVVVEKGFVRWTRSPKSADGSEPHAIGIELAAPSDDSTRQITSYVSAAAATQ